MSPSTATILVDELMVSICRNYGAPAPDSTRTSVMSNPEYVAVVDHPALPGAQETTELRVCRGAAVELADQWAFFDDLAPAAAFARAGRVSNLQSSWDLFEAAEVRAFCSEHHRDEAALLLGRQVYEPSELHAHAARFAAETPARVYSTSWSER